MPRRDLRAWREEVHRWCNQRSLPALYRSMVFITLSAWLLSIDIGERTRERNRAWLQKELMDK